MPKLFGKIKISKLAMTTIVGIGAVVCLMIIKKLLFREGFDPEIDEKIATGCKPKPFIQALFWNTRGHGDCPELCEQAGGTFVKPWPWNGRPFCSKKKGSSEENINEVVKTQVMPSGPTKAIFKPQVIAGATETANIAPMLTTDIKSSSAIETFASYP